MSTDIGLVEWLKNWFYGKGEVYTKTETNTSITNHNESVTAHSNILNQKQETLVSGTNIKTINNESLLGNGNIDISGSGTDLELNLVPKSQNSNGLICISGGKVNYDLDLIYPVGSIYMSVNPTNPSILFGGTWEQIKDTFLLACGDTYSNGATGGEATHTLTTNEMPSHTHTQNQHNHDAPKNFLVSNDNVGINTTKRTLPATGNAGYIVYATSSSGIEEYPHTNNTTATNQNTGGGQAHNNMPPYLTVYVWKRVASPYNSVSLSSDKSIVSFADNESATLTAQLKNNGSSASVNGVTVEFYKDSTSLGTAQTNASGVATMTYVSDGSGDITLTAEADNYTSSPITIEDCFRYDDASSDKSSSYSYDNLSSLTHSVDHYEAYRSIGTDNARYYSPIYVDDTLPTNYEISVDFKSNASGGYQNAISIASSHLGTYQNATEFGVLSTDVRDSIYSRVNGTGSFPSSSKVLSNNTWYNYKVKVDGTSVTATITDMNNVVKYTNTQTISIAQNHKKWSIICGSNSIYTLNWKNLKIKPL